MTDTAKAPERIRGPWSSTDPADEFVVHNPATGQPIAIVAGSGEKQVEEAVRAARAAQPLWRAVTPRARGALLREAAAVVREHTEELTALETSDNGKPLDQARFDVQAAVTVLELFSSLTEAIPSAVRDVGSITDITTLEPYGVVASILPFNWPPIVAAGNLAAALAVGNTFVIKPPEQAPLSVIRLIELVQTVLPDNVVRQVPGTGAVGARLAGHPLVNKVSFTGAPGTGEKVIETAARNLTPTLMELGGKNPLVVFEDADIDSAVRWAFEGGYYNAGEACTAASRVLVHSSIYDEFAARYAAAVSRLRVGDGTDPDSDVGPIVTEAQQRRILDYIEIGLEEGATIAAQAALPDSVDLAGGFFVRPTLFTGVTRDMRIANEEIFGPVVVLIPFDDEDEAISIANGTEYGLVAGVLTADPARLMRVSRAISAGVVFLNHYSRQQLFGSPFGGTKSSGYGRLHAQQTLSEFGYHKTLRLPTGAGEIERMPFGQNAFG